MVTLTIGRQGRLSRRLVTACGILGLWGCSGALLAESQSWLNNSLTWSRQEWKLKATQELRSQGLAYQETFLQNWSAGAFRDLPAGTYLGVSFKQETEDKGQQRVVEERITLEGGWKRTLESELRVDIRVRAEFRDFDAKDDTTRYRLRFRLRRSVELMGVKLGPFVWTELFSGSGDDKTINRNRFGLGTTLGLADHVDLVVNYVRQDTDGKEPINGVNTGIELSF